jgi:hypothetical protein
MCLAYISGIFLFFAKYYVQKPIFWRNFIGKFYFVSFQSVLHLLLDYSINSGNSLMEIFIREIYWVFLFNRYFCDYDYMKKFYLWICLIIMVTWLWCIRYSDINYWKMPHSLNGKLARNVPAVCDVFCAR